MADAIDTEEGRLVGEASHAAGNLIHRLYYLTDVLEGGPHDDEASAALQQVKDALGELHVVVARSLALLKPVNVKTIQADAATVATSIARRLGAATDPLEECEERARLRAMPLEVDPGQLDRAIGLLAEAVAGRGARDEDGEIAASCCSITAEVAAHRLSGRATDRDHGLVIRCKAARERAAALDAQGHVSVALAVAVATRVLRTFRCDARFEEQGGQRELIIFIPECVPDSLKTSCR